MCSATVYEINERNGNADIAIKTTMAGEFKNLQPRYTVLNITLVTDIPMITMVVNFEKKYRTYNSKHLVNKPLVEIAKHTLE